MFASPPPRACSLFLAFRAMFTALFTWPNEQKMMMKERASGMYRLSAFYLARSASDIPSDLSIPTLFLAIMCECNYCTTCRGVLCWWRAVRSVVCHTGSGRPRTRGVLAGMYPAVPAFPVPCVQSCLCTVLTDAHRLRPLLAADLMTGLRHGGYFFLNWLSVMLNTLTAQAFGLFIGATVMNAKTAQTIAAVIMLTFMLVGGFYVTNIPVWIGWIKWTSFLTFAFNLILKIEFGGRTLYDCSLQDKTFNPKDPWNYVASGQVGVLGGCFHVGARDELGGLVAGS
jgi:hypothetical protein